MVIGLSEKSDELRLNFTAEETSLALNVPLCRFRDSLTIFSLLYVTPMTLLVFPSLRVWQWPWLPPSAAHEYANVDGKVATCGITDFAQAALGDIVFVDLPEVGDDFEKGDSFGSVESVKAASDVYAPVTGTIVEVNEALSDEPGVVNNSPEGEGWLIKIEMDDESELDDLMTPEAYKEHCESEAN